MGVVAQFAFRFANRSLSESFVSISNSSTIPFFETESPRNSVALMETKHLLKNERRGHQHGGTVHAPLVVTEIIWPLNPREYLRSIATGAYFHLMKLGGISFLALTILYYGVGALLFSGLYWAVRDTMDPPIHSYRDAFFYSAERMVGLDGRFDPLGALASSTALVQAFVAMLSGAVLTGLLYARFSMPKSTILFSKSLVISKEPNNQSRDALMFRIANSRQSEIKDLTVGVFAVVRYEGYTKLVPLKLLKSEIPSLSIYPVTIFHPLDEESIFVQLGDWNDVCERLHHIVVHVRGTDIIVNGDIFASTQYNCEEIRLNEKLRDLSHSEDIVQADGSRAKKMVIHYKHFNDSVSSPSIRYEHLSVLGGVFSMQEVHSRESENLMN